jgi:A/G-specific adenine glycosylase
MDLAQALCIPRNPRCGACPVADYCAARQAGSAPDLPVKVRKVAVRAEEWHFGVATDGDRFGLVQRPSSGIWSGLYTPPQLESDPIGIEPDVLIHRLSHRVLTLKMYRISRDLAPCTHWFTAEEWSARGMPQAFVHWMTKFTYI